MTDDLRQKPRTALREEGLMEALAHIAHGTRPEGAWGPAQEVEYVHDYAERVLDAANLHNAPWRLPDLLAAHRAEARGTEPGLLMGVDPGRPEGDWTAGTEPGLDVERLARALRRANHQIVGTQMPDGRWRGQQDVFVEIAADVAAEYARLGTPDPTDP